MLKEGSRRDDGSYPEDSSKRQRRCKESVAKVRALPVKRLCMIYRSPIHGPGKVQVSFSQGSGKVQMSSRQASGNVQIRHK